MNAWIEIYVNSIVAYFELVAFYMNAWIEIPILAIPLPTPATVAFYMNAWIEITDILTMKFKPKSHSI